MTAARCPTCDRVGTSCPTPETLIRGTFPMSGMRDIALAAMRECNAHRVDWRARAIAAEAGAARWQRVAPLIDDLRRVSIDDGDDPQELEALRDELIAVDDRAAPEGETP